MPEICRFYGIVIRLYYRDHPPAHFHAEHGTQEALIEIESGRVIRGHLSRAALDLINRWRRDHLQELQMDWELARQREPLQKIAPLP